MTPMLSGCLRAGAEMLTGDRLEGCPSGSQQEADSLEVLRASPVVPAGMVPPSLVSWSVRRAYVQCLTPTPPFFFFSAERCSALAYGGLGIDPGKLDASGMRVFLRNYCVALPHPHTHPDLTLRGAGGSTWDPLRPGECWCGVSLPCSSAYSSSPTLALLSSVLLHSGLFNIPSLRALVTFSRTALFGTGYCSALRKDRDFGFSSVTGSLCDVLCFLTLSGS